MGRRGPRPTPSKIVKLRGNPGKRPVNDREPQPSADQVRCPAWLHRYAKREWRRIVPELKRLGLLTTVDVAALAAYCQAYARWRQAEEFLAEHGLSVELTREDKDGNEVVYAVQQRPEVTISQKERQLMKAYLIEFGLTPSSRTRLRVPEQEQKDAFAEFLSGS